MRAVVGVVLTSTLAAAIVFTAACGDRASEGAAAAASVPTNAPAAPVHIDVVPVREQAVARTISVTGTLLAQEEAEVAAETPGRIVATPVERGTPVGLGAELVRISATEVEAQAQEAEANLAQLVARLGQPDDGNFSTEQVPEVASAGAARDLARADFDRVRALFDRQLVSKAEYEMRRTQAENAERQYEVARNASEQQRQALVAARARLTLARKALADTVVRAPFAGVVAERLVSVGDYVTRGTRVASVLRVNPLRVELTVPAQYVASVAVGRAVSLQVDAYPGETFSGRVRHVSPGVRADSRAFVVEAEVSNDHGRLKPGLFVTARVEGAASAAQALVVPAATTQAAGEATRVFLVVGDHVEERLVTVGQTVGDLVEITTGLAKGDAVAAGDLSKLTDGARVVTR